jgi:hypothetical protein
MLNRRVVGLKKWTERTERFFLRSGTKIVVDEWERRSVGVGVSRKRA